LRKLFQRQPADSADGIDIGLDVSLLGETAVALVAAPVPRKPTAAAVAALFSVSRGAESL